jgi:hypothetical protein
MSEKQPPGYKLDHAHFVKENIQAIAAIAKQAGKLHEFASIMKKAVHLLQNDPHAWGDPEYHSKAVEGIVYHSILRPIAFRFVVYEQVRAVVLLSVKLYADFS